MVYVRATIVEEAGYYLARAVTIAVGGHISYQGICQMYTTAWTVMADKKLGCMSQLRDHEVLGFVRHHLIVQANK